MKKLVFVLGLLFLVSGCGASHKMKAEEYDALYGAGQYKEACDLAIGSESIKDMSDSDKLLWVLNGATAAIAAGDYKYAIDLLDEAENLTKDDDLESGGAKAGKVVAGTLVNDYVRDYDPTQYDKIFVNTYKAICFLELGDFQNARIELARAYARQQRASQLFLDEIKKEQQEIKEKSQNENQNVDYSKTYSAVYEKMEQQNVNDAAQWKPYKDFINPYPTYVNALYRLIDTKSASDVEKAVTDLKRLYAMTGASVVKADLDYARMRQKSLSRNLNKKYLWVIFENGLGPNLKEFRFDVPLFFLGKHTSVKVASLALPRLEKREQAFPFLDIYVDGAKIDRTEIVADIDSVVYGEYDHYFPTILAKSVASMIAKSAMQYGAHEAGGDWASLAVAVFTAVTTEADVRTWQSLPKNVQLARIDFPKSKHIVIKNPAGGIVADLDLSDAKSKLVYIRIPKATSVPSVSVVKH